GVQIEYAKVAKLRQLARAGPVVLSCLSWNWRERSSVKITERAHAKRAKALHWEEKVAILRRHLLDKVPGFDLCEEHGLQPTVSYRWQKEFFENGAAAFQGKSRPDHQAEQQRIEFLEKDSNEGRGAGRIDGRAHRLKKKSCGALTKVWVPHD